MPHILIIDDDAEFRTTLAAMVSAAGHDVTVAADGLEGAQLFRAQPADLLLVDMMMPHSGLTLIRVLREQFSELRVIAMSGGGGHRLDYARSLGAQLTLTKPFSAEKLNAAIETALGGPYKQAADSA